MHVTVTLRWKNNESLYERENEKSQAEKCESKYETSSHVSQYHEQMYQKQSKQVETQEGKQAKCQNIILTAKCFLCFEKLVRLMTGSDL